MLACSYFITIGPRTRIFLPCSEKYPGQYVFFIRRRSYLYQEFKESIRKRKYKILTDKTLAIPNTHCKC